MPDIVLLTINSRFSHCSLALRLLKKNLSAELFEKSEIREYNLTQKVDDIACEILELNPKILIFSTYIWNVDAGRRLLEIFSKVAPHVIRIVGGPEIVETYPLPPVSRLAHCSVLGEGEEVLDELCRKALRGEKLPLFLKAKACNLDRIRSAYDLYDDFDLAHRVVYVESSRGCPYRCAFCLSANDKPVRYFDMEKLLADFAALHRRGLKQFKFLDRTLNASIPRALTLLDFFRNLQDPDLRLHFEMVPQIIPDKLIEALASFPEHAIQIEFGIQTLNKDVADAIHRPLHADVLLENLGRLCRETGVHIHSDLIAGLPFESMGSFARGFDRLYATGVQEIQLGILKRLKGAPLCDKEIEYGLLFAEDAPYEILQSPHMTFNELMQLKNMARVWDIVQNSGNFPRASQKILSGSRGAFTEFFAFSEWVVTKANITQGIALTRTLELLFHYLTEILTFDKMEVAMILVEDYLRNRKDDIPKVLRPHLPENIKSSDFVSKKISTAHRRQDKHAQSNRNLS